MMSQLPTNIAIIDTVEVAQVEATMKKISQFQQVVQKTLHEKHDFGIIPGTDKPTLLKPGAEKILMMMGLRSEFEIVDSARDFEKGFFSIKCAVSYSRAICSLQKALVLATPESANT